MANQSRLTADHRAAGEIMLEALQQPDSGRHKWLSERCGGDTRLLGRVQTLIEHHLRAEKSGFLRQPALPRKIERTGADDQPIRG